MTYFELSTAPIESLLEISENQFPELKNGNLRQIFDSLPSQRLLPNGNDIRRGDILIRRQYGHYQGGWYGVVLFVHGNEAYVLSPGGIRRIYLGKDPYKLDWEVKRLRPDYTTQKSDSGQTEEDRTYLSEDRVYLSEDSVDDAILYMKGSFKERGLKNNTAALTWNPVIATGDNPKNKVYYVVPGAAGYRGARIEIGIKNNNAHKNMIWVYFGIILQYFRSTTQGAVADATTIIPFEIRKGPMVKPEGPTDKPKVQEVQKRLLAFSGVSEIEDEKSATVKFELSPDMLKKAYAMLDKSNYALQFEIFCYWSEVAFPTNDYFWNSIKREFYLVQPFEIVDTKEITYLEHDPDVDTIKFVVVRKKDGSTVQIDYPPLYNNYVVPLTSLRGVGQTMQIEIKVDKIESNTISSSVTNTATNTKTETLEFNIGAEFVEGGLKSIIGLGYKNEASTTLSTEISKSYSNTKTYQESVGVTNTLTFEKSEETKQYSAKLIFAPILVKGYRYSNINVDGIATTREIIKAPFLIWRPVVWAKYDSRAAAVKAGAPKKGVPAKKDTASKKVITPKEDWEEAEYLPEGDYLSETD